MGVARGPASVFLFYAIQLFSPPQYFSIWKQRLQHGWIHMFKVMTRGVSVVPNERRLLLDSSVPRKLCGYIPVSLDSLHLTRISLVSKLELCDDTSFPPIKEHEVQQDKQFHGAPILGCQKWKCAVTYGVRKFPLLKCNPLSGLNILTAPVDVFFVFHWVYVNSGKNSTTGLKGKLTSIENEQSNRGLKN